MSDQPNFLELAPHNLYAIGDNQASIKDVSDYISSILSSPVNLASDNNVKYLAVFRSLKDGLSLLEDASLLPVKSYRDLVSYSKIISSFLAESTNISPADIANTLEKIVAGWNTIDSAAYALKIAVRTRSYISDVIRSLTLPVGYDKTHR